MTRDDAYTLIAAYEQKMLNCLYPTTGAEVVDILLDYFDTVIRSKDTEIADLKNELAAYSNRLSNGG